MALKLNLYQDRRQESDNYGKVYARVKNSSPQGIDYLAEHMATHGSPFSAGTIQGILIDMVDCIKELILMGQPIKLADLAIFKCSVESGCANTAADFDISKNIKAVKLLSQATGDMMKKQLTADAKLEYTELANKVREGRVNISSLYDEEAEGGGTNPDDDDVDPQRP